MILSVSRRTDIPNHYSDWFFSRLQKGWVLVRNPRNPHQLSLLSLCPEEVDGIVFWTKNPSSMMDRLEELEDYAYYFQFTLTPYDMEVEPHIPSKREVLLPLFQQLSRRIGRRRLIWRYDPILFNSRYTPEFHRQYFSFLANHLSDFTEECTLSFLDFYATTRRHTSALKILMPSWEEKVQLLESFVTIAQKVGLSLTSCAEKEDFRSLGIFPGSCVDSKRLIRQNRPLPRYPKDPHQRSACGCVASRDIGAYDTCPNGCCYCYANHRTSLAAGNRACHDPGSPLLFGEVQAHDRITFPSTFCRKAVCGESFHSIFDGEFSSLEKNTFSDPFKKPDF